MDQTRKPLALAESLLTQARWPEAAEACVQALNAGASGFRVHFIYGTALMHGGRLEAALEQLLAALALRPDSLEALVNLAVVQGRSGHPVAAEATSRRILKQRPASPEIWNNLCLSLIQQGRVAEAIEAVQAALELAPEDRTLRQILMFSLNFIATEGLDLAEVHQALCSDLPALPRKPLPDTAERRIRVGYVSNDFRSHPVSSFMASLISSHDRRTFEVFCYSTTTTPDARTRDFQHLAEHFVDISTASDAKAAQTIETDQIDILVDLGGHTTGNRLGVFALRPAPIQVTYLGYPATTGCAFMDFRLVDARTDPDGNEAFSTEQLVRLSPPFLCFYPHFTSPPTAPLPALASGHITFGSFNQAAKISDDTLDLWTRVLGAVPDSSLFLKAQAFSDKSVRDRFRERFAARGIPASRLSFSGFLKSPQDHLTAYERVDVALDTFPYNGTTTTCEALWMGVPVISLVGDLHAARVGYTLLAAVGLDGFAASTPESFTAIAAGLAQDLDQLAILRSRLQAVVAASPLCDCLGFTRDLEDNFRRMLDGHVRARERQQEPGRESAKDGDSPTRSPAD